MSKSIDYPYPETCSSCALYLKSPGGPSHDGSRGCQCGSIASGGKKAHCSCDTCF